MDQRSPNTRRAYARGFQAWSDFCRSVGVHPMSARRAHGSAYTRAMESDGVPNTTANARLAAVSSFYKYAIHEEVTDYNPVENVKRPKIDVDHSDTEGLTEDEMVKLLVEAKKLSPRAYALCLLLYTVGLRVDGALGADVSDLGYDAGHRTLTVRLKGGATAKKALPPVTAHALDVYLSKRTEGPLFATRTGGRMEEPEAWKMLRRVARRADLPQAGSIHPHVLRHCYITHGLDKGVALHIMQDSVDHKDPRTTRRYDRARGRLTNSPAYTVGASIAEKLEDMSV
jgi:site-specific recombinase XerD